MVNSLDIGLIKVERNGNITINGGYVKIDHSVMLEVTGKVVTATGVGPLNALPTDPLTGFPHSGNICT
jgi:hypothetical protein